MLNAQRQFMADASHELRTPVSVVRTTAQVTLARTHRTEDEHQESFTIVAEQATRLSRLVDAMFLLSRAEAQGIPLRREPLYLDDLVAECARALRIVADERGVTIRTCGDAEVTFSGDDTLLRQMVGNPAGVTIRIVDDGEGIPPEQQDRIFERFACLDSVFQVVGGDSAAGMSSFVHLDAAIIALQ